MAATLGKVLEEEARQESGGKVFSVSRLLTRDSSAGGGGAGAAPSFRVYYGVASAGAVPFLWESQPGTPKKDAAADAAVPPLTPPPSYFAHAGKDKEDARGRKGGSKIKKKGGILGSILPRLAMARRRTRPSGSPTSSFSSVSSSSSASSSASSAFSSFRGAQSPAACSSMRGAGGSSSRMRAPPSSSCSSMRAGGGSSRMHGSSSASSFSDENQTAAVPACFGVRGESFRALKGCRVAVTVRSALASVGGNHTAAVQAQSVKAN